MERNKSETCIPIIPDEIIFEILVLLPGNILYNKMRYVCRNWYAIIEHPLFVSRHLMVSPTTLLGPGGTEYRLSHYLSPNGFELCIMATDFYFNLPPCTDGYKAGGSPALRSSCNGLLLIDRDMGKEVNKNLYVGNPVTRRIMPLPPLPKFMHCSILSVYCRLAFAASSKAYKVLVVYDDLRFREERPYRRRCSILTVGIDKAWRKLNLTHLNNNDMEFLTYTLSTTGIIYWAKRSSSYILVLDVESECIKHIQLPRDYEKNNYILRKGNSISFWQVNPDLSMEVWVLKDHETGEWVKFSHIESEPIRYAMKNFLLRNGDYIDDSLLNCIIVQPSIWVENVETIFLNIDASAAGYSGVRTNRHFAFDLKARTCTVCTPTLSLVRGCDSFINSLAWI